MEAVDPVFQAKMLDMLRKVKNLNSCLLLKAAYALLV